MKVSFEKEDFANQPLNFSREQSDVRKEPKIVEYLGGEGATVDKATGGCQLHLNWIPLILRVFKVGVC